MLVRCILPKPWAANAYPDKKKVIEGDLSADRIASLNEEFYSIYYLPNAPSVYEKGVIVDGSHIDTFKYVFVDFDLKGKTYESKDAFLEAVGAAEIPPSRVVDSGNGIHVYWEVSDLDAMSYLRLQRRLCRHFKTDDAVAKIYQLMRLPGTVNTKHEDNFSLCEEIYSADLIYTCEELDELLPPISNEDEQYCQEHFNKTYKLNRDNIKIDDKLPLKFATLLRNSPEVAQIWRGETDDRSKADYRVGHIMFASGFTRDEALSVLVNTAKAMARAPIHRVSYATSIVDKIWTFENTEDKDSLNLSSTVREILEKSGDALKGTRLPCWSYIDNTEHGFRLGQVIGLVAGSGVGKTAMALNMFEGFVQSNPDLVHFYIPLEQQKNEIADRWKTMCGTKTHLYDKVHVLSNYDDDGAYRHLSFDEIKEYLLKFQKVTGKKIGCVVIDHIGALKKQSKNGENQALVDICHEMKAMAVQVNVLLVMQSQAPRDKAGIGDLELNKDAAYGTVFFESYCDYLISLWQPLKRCYSEDKCPTVTAFKFCKIRHKKVNKDVIQEDVCYQALFDPNTERMRELTQDEEKAIVDFWLRKAISMRKKDRSQDIVKYTSIKWQEEPNRAKVINRKANSSTNAPRT